MPRVIDIGWFRNTEGRGTAPESDSHFGKLIEKSAVATTLVGPDGRFLAVNPAMCEMFGYDAVALTHMTWADLTAPEYLAASSHAVQEIQAGRAESHRMTKEYIHADGHRVWGQLTLSCIRDAGGTVEHLLAQIVDITEQEKLRARQAEADARFRRLMETSDVAMALVAPDGRLDLVNGALCRLLGYDEETIKTKTWQEITPPDYLEADLKSTEDLVSGRLDTYRVLKQFIRADGRLTWVDVSASCLRDAGGAVQHLVALGVDVNDRVEALELLSQQEHKNRMLADRLQAELRNAAEYVRSVLPPDLHGPVEISSRYLPALDLGGDGFQFRWVDDDHLKVYLIDASGHGVRPALLSMSAYNLIRSDSLSTPTLLDPELVLEKLNTIFQMDDQGGSYFTIWYGIYQRSTRTLRYASAGHPPALALTRAVDGAVTATRLSTAAYPIGMFADTVFTSDTYQVPEGGQLLLYSDGAYELPLDSERRNRLSLDGFVDLCTELAARPGWSLDGLVDRLRLCSPTGEFDDDCALVLLTFP